MNKVLMLNGLTFGPPAEASAPGKQLIPITLHSVPTPRDTSPLLHLHQSASVHRRGSASSITPKTPNGDPLLI